MEAAESGSGDQAWGDQQWAAAALRQGTLPTTRHTFHHINRARYNSSCVTDGKRHAMTQRASSDQVLD